MTQEEHVKLDQIHRDLGFLMSKTQNLQHSIDQLPCKDHDARMASAICDIVELRTRVSMIGAIAGTVGGVTASVVVAAVTALIRVWWV